MPSFDITSKIDLHELNNALDQANRTLDTRFDFKGSGARFTYEESTITLTAPSAFQLTQMADVFGQRVTNRGLDLRSFDFKTPQISNNQAKQSVTVKQGIEQELGKSIIKSIKAQKYKVQAAIQGDQIRVTAKKRDELQTVIRWLESQDLGIPIQFDNFRD